MGLFSKIKKAWFDTIVWETIDDEFYDELEESLILADLGVEPASRAVKTLRERVDAKWLHRTDEIRDELRMILAEMLQVGVRLT